MQPSPRIWDLQQHACISSFERCGAPSYGRSPSPTRHSAKATATTPSRTCLLADVVELLAAPPSPAAFFDFFDLHMLLLASVRYGSEAQCLGAAPPRRQALRAQRHPQRPARWGGGRWGRCAQRPQQTPLRRRCGPVANPLRTHCAQWVRNGSQWVRNGVQRPPQRPRRTRCVLRRARRLGEAKPPKTQHAQTRNHTARPSPARGGRRQGAVR